MGNKTKICNIQSNFENKQISVDIACLVTNFYKSVKMSSDKFCREQWTFSSLPLFGNAEKDFIIESGDGNGEKAMALFTFHALLAPS